MTCADGCEIAHAVALHAPQARRTRPATLYARLAGKAAAARLRSNTAAHAARFGVMTPRFHSVDPNPNAALASLGPSSSRVRSWIARAIYRPGFPLNREVQIRGAVDILRGLEYHHGRFMSQLAEIEDLTSGMANRRGTDGGVATLPTSKQFEVLATLHHEAVAYVSRLGQLHFFARSLGLRHLLDGTAELLPFRHKYAAHRSIDMPQAESADEQQSQAMAFGFAHTFEGGFPVFRLLSAGKFHTLNMRLHHPLVMAEAVALFEAIFPLPDDAL